MKKPQWLLIGITLMFMCILVGLFIGRNTGNNYIAVNNVTPSGATETDQSNPENDGKININTATKQQLMLLPGIGETTAQKIIDYRTENGNYKTIEDLMNVSGIGQKKFEQIKDKIKAE